MDDLLQFLGIMIFTFLFICALIGPVLRGKTIKEKWQDFYNLATRDIYN